jgi:DNA-binding GntR family transcriptional regulator
MRRHDLAEVGQQNATAAHGLTADGPLVGETGPASADVSITTVDEGYAVLREAIRGGVLVAGEVYSQADVTARLGITRTPLREAIRRLQSEGFLEYQKNRRLRIAPLRITDLCDIYSMRVVLEPLAVRLSLPRLTPSEVDAVGAALNACNEASLAVDYVATRHFHREFHQLLYSRAGARLVHQVNELRDHAERYRTHHFQSSENKLALLNLAQARHAAIYEAARAGDSAECADQVAQHLMAAALTLFAAMDSDFDPVELRTALRVARFGCGPSSDDR